MKTASLFILLLLVGCKAIDKKIIKDSEISPLQLNPMLGGSAPKVLSAGGNAQPESVIQPQWPDVTLRIVFTGFDVGSAFNDEWTNWWTCDALTSMDITKPLEQWDRYKNVDLTNFNGELGFEITTNAPWINVAAEFTTK